MLDNRFGMLRETRDGGSATARLRRATQRVCGEDSSSRLPWVRCELRQPHHRHVGRRAALVPTAGHADQETQEQAHRG